MKAEMTEGNGILVNPILTITGSDGTGGAGVQADVQTITALGGYAVSAITSVTLQNTLGIQDFYDLPVEVVAGQIEAIIDDVEPCAVKIGMIRNAALADTIVELLKKRLPAYVVCDPVITSSRGDLLMSEALVETLRHKLFPLCTIITIRKTDAACILQKKIETISEMVQSARELLATGAKAVLMEGEHGVDETVTDVLVVEGNLQETYFSYPEPVEAKMHGLAGVLSSAITTFLSQGITIEEAVDAARKYANKQFANKANLMGRSRELYDEFVNQMLTHYRTNSDVRFYADKLNVSSRYLAQVCKKMTGKSPKQLIDEHLLKEIKVALSTTDKTIQEIAYQFGFSSQAHFTKFFRKSENSTPSEYRKK